MLLLKKDPGKPGLFFQPENPPAAGKTGLSAGGTGAGCQPSLENFASVPLLGHTKKQKCMNSYGGKRMQPAGPEGKLDNKSMSLGQNARNAKAEDSQPSLWENC